MTVELLHATPLDIADKAISKCWDKEAKVMRERMYRVGIKNKHASTLEHVTFSFDIDGVSRALLQELARHRVASLSVKSTRYTLKELKDYTGDLQDFLVYVNPTINSHNVSVLKAIRYQLNLGVSNDTIKYMLPEAYKTSLVWTINMRSLQNFLSLRTSKAALWEIRQLAHMIFESIPDGYKFMFDDFVKE
jgi:thymidylate synthase (FAD)